MLSVQFLVPASALYCSICKIWLGDNHCASKHVQSNQHAQNYSEYVMRNPHWEMDWITERTRSYERNSEAKHQLLYPSPTPSMASSLSLASFSDQLLAMIAANSKIQPTPIPPPPPTVSISASSSSSSSSSSDDDDEDDYRDKKKRRKGKHIKKGQPLKQRKSPSKEKTSQCFTKKVDIIPVDENFISNWNPPEKVSTRKQSQEGSRGKSSERYGRKQESSSDFDDKDSGSKKRNEKESTPDRPRRYERENSKEKTSSRYDERYKSQTSYKYK